MRTALALSGESPGRDLLAEFDHIGLIRGEYLFRDHGLYPTAEHARPVLREYLDRLCREAAVFELDAILTAGAAHVIVGTNDLSSLLLGRARVLGTATVTSPALESALTETTDR